MSSLMIRTTVSWLNVTLGGGVHGDEKKNGKKKNRTQMCAGMTLMRSKKKSSSASMLFQTKKVK